MITTLVGACTDALARGAARMTLLPVPMLPVQAWDCQRSAG